MTAFDTLKLSRRLRERAHFDQEQAEGVAEALAEAFAAEVATKADILLLQNDIKRLEERVDQTATKADIGLLQQETKADIALLRQELTMLEQRLTIKVGAMLAAAVGILLALEKFMGR